MIVALQPINHETNGDVIENLNKNLLRKTPEIYSFNHIRKNELSQ